MRVTFSRVRVIELLCCVGAYCAWAKNNRLRLCVILGASAWVVRRHISHSVKKGPHRSYCLYVEGVERRVRERERVKSIVFSLFVKGEKAKVKN